MKAFSKRLLFFGFIISNISLFNNIEAKKIKIGFFINYLSVRGTEVSTFDYADYNETILGNESFIINYIGDSRYFNGQALPDYSLSTREKFSKRFGARFYECSSMKEMDEVLLKEKIAILYMQKAGARDDKFSQVCKNAIHVVFPEFQPHGNVYACISQWLSQVAPMKLPYVPYMVRLDDTTETLRKDLGIPLDAVVFGRHGGADSFDLSIAQEAVREIAQQKKDWYFVFLNTNKFCDLPNVIFLPATADMHYKTKFINTCDVMIHARNRGETFGLACAEFSMKNKLVVTWMNSPERSHIDILGNKGLYYRSKDDLMKIISMCGTNIHEIRTKNWDAYSEKFNPHAVMQKFDEVFIQPLIK